MKKYLVIIFIIIFTYSCKSELLLSYNDNYDSWSIYLNKKTKRYNVGLHGNGDWKRKGNLFVLNSDLDPKKIEHTSLKVIGNSNSTVVINAKHKQSGARPDSLVVFLMNDKEIKKIILGKKNNYFSISKENWDYDSLYVAIPIPYDYLDYSVSATIPVDMGDTITIQFTAKAANPFYIYFKNRAFLKKGKYFVDPIPLQLDK